MLRRTLLLATPALSLTGCAALNQVSAEVRSYGTWPAERKPGRFVFERLPSQGADGARAAQTEALALPALQAAGFVQVASRAEADLIVALGARITRTDFAPWDDPLWVRWPLLPRHALLRPVRYPWHGGHPFYLETRFDREVAILLRDRASGEPLFEARATNDGLTAGSDGLLSAMFRAALSGFPAVDPTPRWVQVPLA